jgi:hypothetical protein
MAEKISYIERIREKDDLEFWDTSLRKEWNVLTIQEKVSAFMAVHKGDYTGNSRRIYTNVLQEEDLKFIYNNRNYFTKEQFQSLWAQEITLSNDNSIVNSGFKYNFEALKFEEIPKDQSYLNVLIEILNAASSIEGYDVLSDFTLDGERNLTNFVLENNEKIFQLVAYDEFSFKNYDKEIILFLNKYLKSGPSVRSLKRVIGETGGEYKWMTGNGGSISSDRIHLVDPSLLQSEVDDYTRPFKFLGREGSKSEEEGFGINDVLFDEDSSFSDLKISNVKSKNATFWNNVTKDNQINLAKQKYFKFFISFLSLLPYESGQTFDIDEVRQEFRNSIFNYLSNQAISYFNEIAWDTDEQFTLPVNEYIAKIILDDLRYNAWLNYVKEINALSQDEIDQQSNNVKNLAKAAFGAGEEAALNSNAFDRDPNAPEDDGLTEDEIQERQRFLKQCAIMTRLDEMANEHEKIVFQRAREKFDSNSVPRPVHYYDGRLYMIKDGDLDQHGIVSKLLLPKASNIQEFLEIEPSTHAYLVPKLRFFKIFQEGSTSKQEEFRFRNFTLSERVNNLKNIDYDKGGDFGIKEFTFSFEGTTPATAKNDIKANLSLYFQSFDDFINTQPENKSPFVDMLLLPGGSTKKGSGQESPFQFQPEYYRLRVDVGWIIPDKSLEKQIGTEKYNSLLDALRKTNKSFYLNMVDHTIDFRDDGSVQIDVEYRAYIESALKGTILDALASRETREAAKKTKEEYAKILKTQKCNAKELGQIKRQLAQIEELLKKQTYQSIMNRLIMYDMLYFKKLKTTSANSFVKNGFFTNKVRFTSDSEQPSSTTNLEEATKGSTFDYGSDFYNEDINTDKDHLFVNYFYLGDLLYVILDSLYEDDGSYISGFENFKFVLGSLQYEDIFDSQFKTINIASIPISAELFFEWFTENIIKPERNSYPIMFFIRDLLKFLVGEILSETCFKRSLDKKLQFHTTNFIGIDNPLSRINGYSMEPVIDANIFYNSGYLPLIQDDGQAHPISDFTNYIMIYVDTPKLAIEGKNGNKKDDGDIGIYHYQIGKPKGLLKKLKFSKTDMQYIREARFFRNGFDGLMQLANVYSVNLDMIGNTLYYPGMEIYVNPLGFMGAANNNYDPTERNSIANKLGFGGYHLVTSVKSSIGPGKFTTQVTAMFNYSGDGDPAKLVTGTSDQVKKVNEVEEIDNRPQTNKDYCSAVYNSVINSAIDIVSNRETTYPGIDFQVIDQRISESAAAKVEAIDAELTNNLPSFDELRARQNQNKQGGN